MNAPTEKITNNYKWLQFTKIQLSRVDYYTHFPHSFQQFPLINYVDSFIYIK